MIKKLRNDIDLIDKEISSLLEKRLRAVLKIGEIKAQNHIDIYDGDRERLVLEGVIENVSDFSKPYVKELYKKIFEISRECQKNGR